MRLARPINLHQLSQLTPHLIGLDERFLYIPRLRPPPSIDPLFAVIPLVPKAP